MSAAGVSGAGLVLTPEEVRFIERRRARIKHAESYNQGLNNAASLARAFAPDGSSEETRRVLRELADRIQTLRKSETGDE